VDAFEGLARRFDHFARTECGEAPLYRRLAAGIADDPTLLALATHGQAGPKPNLFLAAVHYLMLQGVAHPVRAFYPSVSAHAAPPDDPYPAFRAFCLEQTREIRTLMENRRVQTNEVARAAYLVPSLHLVAQRTKHRPLALIELGASAGLLLLWDRYGYDFGGSGRLGELDALAIGCELVGPRRPALPTSFPAVAARMGIDLNPIDVRDLDAALWLRALVWPEHRDRAERLERAMAIVAHEPPRLMAGNALEVLPNALSRIPPEAAVCIFHAHTLNQASPDARQQLLELLAAQSVTREIHHLSMESRAVWHARSPTQEATLPAQRRPELRALAHYELEWRRFARGGLTEQAVLARYHPHGGWLEWLL
jgi:hypothetical protein